MTKLIALQCVLRTDYTATITVYVAMRHLAQQNRQARQDHPGNAADGRPGDPMFVFRRRTAHSHVGNAQLDFCSMARYHAGNIDSERFLHVITRKRLIEFAEKHPSARAPLLAWFSIMKRARFARPGELLAVFGSADLVGGARVVFDIGGNKYRLIADVNYGRGRIYVRAVLTHEEYARIDVRTLKRKKH